MSELEILAMPGSVRTRSYNLALLNAAAKMAPKNVNVEVYKDLRHIPVFDPENDELPGSVDDLIVALRKADGVFVSTPEYAYGVPGVLKNALDWLVSSDALVLKPVVVTSVSTSGLGGSRAHGSLVSTLSAMNANVVVEGSLNVPYSAKKFDDDLNLIDDLTTQALYVSLAALTRAVRES